jgi:hypothetical protein
MPIVFQMGADPVELSIVASLSQLGSMAGNSFASAATSLSQ